MKVFGTATVVMVLLMGCLGQNSPGTKMLLNFDKTLSGVQNNMYKGITAVNTPMVKFTVDTVPHLAHIYILVQGVQVPPKIAALAKESVGRLTLLAGTLGSDAAVLGSSVFSDVTRLTSVVLEAQNEMASNLEEKDIKLGGEMVDSLVNVTSLGVDAAAVGLTALGDTLVTASQVNGAMSGGSARLITAIGEALKKGLVTAQKATYTIASPILGLTAKKEQTTNMASYLTTLKSAQKVFDKLVDASEKENSTS